MSDLDNLPAVVAAEQEIEQARSQPLTRHPAVLPSPDEWAATMVVARTIAGTEFVPKDYRGRPESVVAAILMGREIGIGPMESLRQITMIDGRPTLSAALMLSKMRENGVVILDSKVDDERAWIRAQRTDTGEIAEVEWTYAEAEKITRGNKRLVDGDNWQNYRQDMLWARCVGRLARRLGSDLLGGNLYSTEEVRDFDSTTTYESVGDGTSPYFNRAEMLLPGAIRTGEGDKGVPALIMERLAFIEPTIDWPETIKGVIHAAYGVEGFGQIPEERGREFWIRLANATVKAGEKMTGDFPPAEPSEIVNAFMWAFELDLLVELVLKGEVEHPAGEPDVEPEEAAAVAAEIDEPGDGNVVEAPDPATLAAEAAATDFGEADK